MDNFGKPNFYGRSAGENIGEDIVQSSNSYEDTVEALQRLDQDQNYHQIDVSRLDGKSAATSGKETSIVSNVDQQKAEKKRKIDKAYRERCKMKNDQMRKDLVSLGHENEDLKIENRSLKEKNAPMYQRLQSQREELNQYKIRLGKLKFENEKQTVLLHILSDHVVNHDLCLENKKLKDENALLRETIKLSGGPLMLVEENANLHLENLLMKVKVDALCGKIVDENRKSCGHK